MFAQMLADAATVVPSLDWSQLFLSGGVIYLISDRIFAERRRKQASTASRENAEIEWLRKEMAADRAQSSADRAATSEKIGKLEEKVEQMGRVIADQVETIERQAAAIKVRDEKIAEQRKLIKKNYDAWAGQKKRADALAIELQNAVRAALPVPPAQR